MEAWYVILVVGLVCGIFSATFGVGSGIILIPTLVLLLSMPQKTAQGTCLAVMVPMALVGAISYKLNPQITVDLRITVLLAIGAVVGAVVGAAIAGWLPASTLRKGFAIVMIIAAIRMLMSSPKRGEAEKSPPAPSGISSPESTGET
jgi:uncharacterized protein